MSPLLCATCGGKMAPVKGDAQGRSVCFECGSYTCRCAPRTKARAPLPSASNLTRLDQFHSTRNVHGPEV